MNAQDILDAALKLEAYLESPEFESFSHRASVQRDQLNAATEDLNAALREAEKALVGRFKGRCAAIEFDDHTALLFWQVKGRWGLFILDDMGHLLPLQNASRQRRQEAASLLADLSIQLMEEDNS